jgi:hypothetical protein
MVRRAVALVFIIAVISAGAGGAGAAAQAQVVAPIQLVLPQGDAFAFLGHSCGGIQEQTYATGFDTTTGFPTGDVYAKTSCGGSGRGGGYHVTTYSAWISVTWDFTGAVLTYAKVTTVSVDPGLTTFDSNGNEVYNASNNAYLLLADGYVPTPRVTGISTSAGPAAGATSVTITGDAFTAATQVYFGTTPAAASRPTATRRSPPCQRPIYRARVRTLWM